MAEELDKIADQDERIKNHLSRRDKISQIVKVNKTNIEQSLNCLEIGHKSKRFNKHD